MKTLRYWFGNKVCAFRMAELEKARNMYLIYVHD